ncbi:MAG TPA: hypothetical protein DDY20_05015 [Desulfobulbaceae bacterium]|jgi:hypothetical protein|nr:hypothetical protein [Desulfobulbaceae bacterium]
MKLLCEMGSKNIREAIASHPRIGEILDRFEIGCTKCTVGTCLLQDVMSVHFLGTDTEARIEQEINAYLEEQEPVASGEKKQALA